MQILECRSGRFRFGVGPVFAVVLIMCASLGALIAHQFGRVDGPTLKIAEGQINRVRLLAEMRSAAYQLRLAEPEYTLRFERTGRSEVDRLVEAANARRSQAERQFKPDLSNAESQALWDQVEHTRDEYLKTSAKLMQFEVRDETDIRSASDYFHGPSLEAFSAYVRAIEVCSEFNAMAARKAREASHRAYGQAQNVALVLLAFVVFTASALSLRLLRRRPRVHDETNLGRQAEQPKNFP